MGFNYKKNQTNKITQENYNESLKIFKHKR